jgi:hypothetical protein
MRISLVTFLVAALVATAPAAAQSVRSVPQVVQPRVDAAQQRQQGMQQAVQQAGQTRPDSTRPQAEAPAQAPAQPQLIPPPQPPQLPQPSPSDTVTLLPTATVVRPGEPVLVFERETFSYPGASRRDPFRPLTGDEGPLFEDLKINVILHSPDPSKSVVLVSDKTNRVYRVRRGETVGQCCTVVDISPTRIVFSVVDFGIRRQEVLALKSQREGA